MKKQFVIVDGGVFAPGEVVFQNADKALVLAKAAEYNAGLAGHVQAQYNVFELVPVAA